MKTKVTFVVPGRPQQKGSKRPMHSATTGKTWTVDMNTKAKSWQHAVACAAQEAMQGDAPFRGPVRVSAVLRFCRPKKHFLPATKLRPMRIRDNAPHYLNSAPDVDKIVRTALDGMSGQVFADDGQCHLGRVDRLWSDVDDAQITVEVIDEYGLFTTET